MRIPPSLPLAGRSSLLLRRRGLLQSAAALSGAAVLGISGGTAWADAMDDAKPDWSAAGIDWQQQKGKRLLLAAVQHPWTNAIKPLIPHFTALTGIDVDVQQQSETEYAAQLPVRLGSGSSTPDVYMAWAVGQAIQAGWLEPLDAMMSDKKLLNPAWWDGNDFFPSAQQFQVWSDSKQYLMPITAEVQIMIMNKTMLDAKGLGVPKTMEELLSTAKAVKTADVAGIAMRAKPTGDSAWGVGGFIFGYGGAIIDMQGNVALTKPETIEAVDMFGRMLREAGPLGVSSYQWTECLNDFMSGAVAMNCDSSMFAGQIADPKLSAVAGHAEYGLIPQAGNHPIRPNMWHWMIGTNSKSQNKEAAFLFMQWANSKPTTLAMAATGFPTARVSSWESQGFQTHFGENAATVALNSLKVADAGLMKATWYHPKGPQILDALAIAVNETATGASSAKQALKVAAAKAQAAIG
jgi:multiple sugar transport system substrate-binding protein